MVAMKGLTRRYYQGIVVVNNPLSKTLSHSYIPGCLVARDFSCCCCPLEFLPPSGLLHWPNYPTMFVLVTWRKMRELGTNPFKETLDVGSVVNTPIH